MVFLETVQHQRDALAVGQPDVVQRRKIERRDPEAAFDDQRLDPVPDLQRHLHPALGSVDCQHGQPQVQGGGRCVRRAVGRWRQRLQLDRRQRAEAAAGCAGAQVDDAAPLVVHVGQRGDLAVVDLVAQLDQACHQAGRFGRAAGLRQHGEVGVLEQRQQVEGVVEVQRQHLQPDHALLRIVLDLAEEVADHVAEHLLAQVAVGGLALGLQAGVELPRRFGPLLARQVRGAEIAHRRHGHRQQALEHDVELVPDVARLGLGHAHLWTSWGWPATLRHSKL